MEAKKNPKYDVNRKRGMFFNIGLIISIGLVISAFEWTTEKQGVVELVGNFDEIELMDIQATVQKPPERPKPKVQPVKIEEVSEEEDIEDLEIEIDMEFDEDDVIEEIPLPEEEEVVETVFNIVEEQPAPMDGMAGFYDFIKKHLKYPKMAKKLNIQGRVYVQFVVDKDGSLTEIKSVKGIGGGCDEEAVRVLNKAPKWKSGKQRGKPVKVRMIMPISFKLG